MNLSITMPLPPSANALYRNLKSGGRVKTREYKAWLNDAEYAVIMAWRGAGKPEVADKTPMVLTISAGIRNRLRDLGNVEKAIADVLVKQLPIPDDRWFDDIHLVRSANADGLVHITIAPIMPPPPP